MLIEHLLYSSAIAVVVGFFWNQKYGRDPSWIIIISAYVPDIDIINHPVIRQITGITININGFVPIHGDLHNIFFLLIYALLLGLIFYNLHFRFFESTLFAGTGFAAHLVEDALIASPAYAFFWPLYVEKLGIGIFSYQRDIMGIANSIVLLWGFVFLSIAIILRTFFEGRRWYLHYTPDKIASTRMMKEE